ncbi:MAG: hypothetical protein K2M19_08765 [Muribaculaceae bacterium]|nr:hypothetical protein [Muribaculaceae bacterium]
MGLSPLVLCFAKSSPESAFVRKNLANYFDYKAFLLRKRQADNGRELFIYDYPMGSNGHVFRRI